MRYIEISKIHFAKRHQEVRSGGEWWKIIIQKAKVIDVELGKHSEALRQLLLNIPQSELETYLYPGSKVKEKGGIFIWQPLY